MAKILVVDDEKDVVDLLKFLLEKDGHSVHTASDGEEAVRQAHTVHPDLIVLDIMMPKKDGYTVHMELQESEDTRGIPTIVLTAKGGVRDLFQMAGNVAAYIEKPFDPKILRDKIQQALGRS